MILDLRLHAECLEDTFIQSDSLSIFVRRKRNDKSL